MMISSKLYLLFFAIFLLQLFAAAETSDCKCDSTHGFVKLIGSKSQRQLDLWLDFNEKVDSIELNLRRQYFDLDFPFQVGMWFYKDAYKLDAWKSFFEYGFRPQNGVTLNYKLFNRTGPSNSSEPMFLPGFHLPNFQLVQIARDQRPTAAFYVDFNAPIRNVLEQIGNRDGGFYVEMRYNLYNLDPKLSLSAYQLENKNVTLTAKTQISVHH